MRLPILEGLIRRRLLINYRADADVVRRLLPAPFRPKLHQEQAIVGICLIRLESIRPRWLPAWAGVHSENAAHRIAVEWTDQEGPKEGVYIPRRDTGSKLNHLVGGRLFPGEHHHADFSVSDQDGRIRFKARARDGGMKISLQAHETDAWPASSVFSSVAESSDFFHGGSIGYSATGDCCRLDGLKLDTALWQVRPLAVDSVESSFYDDEARFPRGSIHLDHALIMRDIPHRWLAVADLRTGAAA